MYRRKSARQGFVDAATFERLRENLPAYLQDFAEFAFITGWRRGEIASLDWSNVQDDDTMIRLRPDQAKNKTTDRSVPVAGKLIDIIKRRRGARANSHLVFHREGVPVCEFRSSWETACRLAERPELIFHDLRRSAVRGKVKN